MLFMKKKKITYFFIMNPKLAPSFPYLLETGFLQMSNQISMLLYWLYCSFVHPIKSYICILNSSQFSNHAYIKLTANSLAAYRDLTNAPQISFQPFLFKTEITTRPFCVLMRQRLRMLIVWTREQRFLLKGIGSRDEYF